MPIIKSAGVLHLVSELKGWVLATEPSTVPPLVLADESTADQYVTGGLLRLPAERVETAVAALAKAKTDRGLSVNAEIHCRVLFSGDARRRSPFAALNPQQCVELITACVEAMDAPAAPGGEPG